MGEREKRAGKEGEVKNSLQHAGSSSTTPGTCTTNRTCTLKGMHGLEKPLTTQGVAGRA